MAVGVDVGVEGRLREAAIVRRGLVEEGGSARMFLGWVLGHTQGVGVLLGVFPLGYLEGDCCFTVVERERERSEMG